jgi:hypothetical protein
MRKIAIVVSASLALAALALPVARSAADHVRVVPGGVYVAPPVTQTPAPVPAPTTVTVVPAPSPVTQVPGTVTVVPAPPSTVVIPAPTTTVATAQQILHAEQIRAQVVRANTIYANRIETDQVKGVIHHTDSVKVNAPAGEMVGPDVTASVIYADAISANSVVADHVYVRDLEMSPAKFVIAPLQSGIVVRRQSP